MIPQWRVCILWATVAVALVASLLYLRHLARARGEVNYGSSMVAVGMLTDGVNDFRRKTGRLPELSEIISNQFPFGGSDLVMPLVCVVTTNELREEIVDNTVIVVGRRLVRGGTWKKPNYRYVGLGSGHVFLMPVGAAQLGRRCESTNVALFQVQ